MESIVELNISTIDGTISDPYLGLQTDRRDTISIEKLWEIFGFYGQTTGKELNGRPIEVFMCSVFKRKGYGEASAGSPSTLTDVWTVKIGVLLLGTDPIHSFLMSFSNRTRKALQPHLVLKSQASVSSHFTQRHVLFSTWLGGHAAHLLKSVSTPGLGSWQNLVGEAVCHQGATEKKNMSHLCGWFQKKCFHFSNEVLMSLLCLLIFWVYNLLGSEVSVLFALNLASGI